MNTVASPESLTIPVEFAQCLEQQQAHFAANRYPSRAQREADLRSLVRLIAENRAALVAAVNQDYGCRASFETEFAEIAVTLDGLQSAIKSLKKWMRPQKRHIDHMQMPLAKARLIPQPIGVVAIVVPWNFPIAMVFHPLTCIFAAGNTAMVKMSENSNHLARLLKEIAPKYFPESKLAFFEDGGGRGPAFTTLPYDHIFFTGSPTTGKAVMANAAKNLTPVTLELGGKSPCVIAPDYSITTAAERIMWAKMLNAGQICTNVDYLFVPEGKVDEFVAQAKRICNARHPNINNGDYTAVIDQRSYDRLQAALADAKSKGATIINLFDGQQPDASRRIMAPHLVLNPTEEMDVMQREIFGPILPIKTYKTKEQVAAYINEHPRPLAFYAYSKDSQLVDWYLYNTISGGVTINDSLLHVSVHSLPFGGIGNSGMGHYHGYEGFTTFSKMRPVLYQGPIRTLNMMLPPYGPRTQKILDFMIKLKS
jgi:coniferyl-aldehyde dehydrogenase